MVGWFTRCVSLLAVLMVLGIAAACGATGTASPSPDAGRTYVGKVDGTDAYIAVVTNSTGTEAAAYVCDGAANSLWVSRSPLAGGSGNLLGRLDGAVVGNVAVSGNSATGTINLAGTPHVFTAQLASAPAGLHRDVERSDGKITAETGWVVLPDGSFRGARVTATSRVPAAALAGLPVGWSDPDPSPWTDPTPIPSDNSAGCLTANRSTAANRTTVRLSVKLREKE